MEMMGKGNSECHKLAAGLNAGPALHPFCRAERGSTAVRMAGCSFAQVAPTAREASGFAWVLPTALVCVRGMFFFSLTTKQGRVCFPCHTGRLWLIPKGNQFTRFLSHALTLGLSFLHISACKEGWKHRPVWDHNNVDQSLFITAHHGR